MPLKILIIPDKFKGTLTAAAAARAIARGWSRVRPGDKLDLLPMTDGGDGFGEVMGILLRARTRQLTTVDAAHRPCVSWWWWEPKTKTAVVESAKVIGLAMLPPGRFHPFELDTFGLGKMLQTAASRGAGLCLIGIGGSATNDAGFGMARALGWKFLDRHANPIEHWTKLDRLAKIQPPARFHLCRLLVAVDVQNPLLGIRGATRVYGPQKGLRPDDFPLAERCLRRLAMVIKRDFGREFDRTPGAGAAGGLGFGLMAFAGARLESGFDLFARHAKLDQRLRGSDVVIVGEGAIDASTFMGKGVGQVITRCREQGIPVIALAGSISSTTGRRKFFAQNHALLELTSLQQAKTEPEHWLELLAARAASKWNCNRDKAVAIR